MSMFVLQLKKIANELHCGASRVCGGHAYFHNDAAARASSLASEQQNFLAHFVRFVVCARRERARLFFF